MHVFENVSPHQLNERFLWKLHDAFLAFLTEKVSTKVAEQEGNK